MIDSTLTMADDFTAGLDRLGKEVEAKVLFSGAAAMALVFYDEVRINVLKHYKTGTLYNSIYRVYSEAHSKPERVVYEVSWNKTKAPHGHLIEFGTSRAPAYPFLRPAFSVAPAALDAGLARMTERMSEVKAAA